VLGGGGGSSWNKAKPPTPAVTTGSSGGNDSATSGVSSGSSFNRGSSGYNAQPATASKPYAQAAAAPVNGASLMPRVGSQKQQRKLVKMNLNIQKSKKKYNIFNNLVKSKFTDFLNGANEWCNF
jgi:hypothetical protein